MSNTYDSAEWVKGVNSSREQPDGRFLRNCVDACRAFLSSWYGKPKVAAAVSSADKKVLEDNGNETTAGWLETTWRTSEDKNGEQVTPTWSDVEERLRRSGHGSAAIVAFERWSTTLKEYVGHSVNAVNYRDTIYWVDPQKGRISTEPMYEAKSDFMAIVLDSNLQPVDPPPPLVDPDLAAAMQGPPQ